MCANHVEGEVAKLLAQRSNVETKAFCCVLLNFFKYIDFGGIKDKYCLSVPPSAAILQNELAPYLPMSADRKALLDKACFLAALSGGIVVWVDKVREMTVFPVRWGCGVSIIFLWKGMTRRARRRRKKLWKRNLPEGLAQGIGRMVLLGHNTDW